MLPERFFNLMGSKFGIKLKNIFFWLVFIASNTTPLPTGPVKNLHGNETFACYESKFNYFLIKKKS